MRFQRTPQLNSAVEVVLWMTFCCSQSEAGRCFFPRGYYQMDKFHWIFGCMVWKCCSKLLCLKPEQVWLNIKHKGWNHGGQIKMGLSIFGLCGLYLSFFYSDHLLPAFNSSLQCLRFGFCMHQVSFSPPLCLCMLLITSNYHAPARYLVTHPRALSPV